ncbi:MAG: sodium-dependent transporter [bacterium]|nr:sodium-dependent transporter [bacterium]
MSQAPIDRGRWKTRIGFILAASGSAIGLGNIVFFSANAYKFGGGAFYLPYLLALFAIGIPVMMLEFGLGSKTGRAFPEALHIVAGKKGEFVGWWGILNAGFLTMYYITILSWVLGMLIGSFGALWQPTMAVPAFDIPEGVLPTATAYFFQMLTTAKPLIFVVIVWALNVLIIRRGVQSIEAVTKVFVPLMWIFMAILIVRGVTLPNGTQGVYLLFTPNFDVMKDPAVWQGAFSQIFFTLSLGFGTMVAYASYLPKNSDLAGNSFVTSFLNCGFEYLAGLAVFSVLFAFAIVPQASTLSMMFFIVPQGIAQMPAGVQLFGIVFFLLLLIAGLTSSVSLIEGIVSALRDKFGWARGKTIAVAAGIGVIGSCMFALPQVVDPGLENNGTIGLTLLDLIDHWVFSYGLLAIGLAQCILVGWVLGASKIRAYINENSSTRIGPWFDVLIKFVIPAALAFILGYSLYNEFQNGLYGMAYNENYREGAEFMRAAPVAVLMVWFLTSTFVALLLTKRGNYAQES